MEEIEVVARIKTRIKQMLKLINKDMQVMIALDLIKINKMLMLKKISNIDIRVMIDLASNSPNIKAKMKSQKSNSILRINKSCKIRL